MFSTSFKVLRISKIYVFSLSIGFEAAEGGDLWFGDTRTVKIMAIEQMVKKTRFDAKSVYAGHCIQFR